MSLSRRHALGLAASAAFAGLARAQTAPTPPRANLYGPIREDPAGIFDLPDGFSYRIVSRAGEPMDDGFRTPGRMDGMACFALDADRVILVRNHELHATDLNRSPFGADGVLAARLGADRAYDRRPDGIAMPGGTTTVVWDLRKAERVTQHLSLIGTLVNCAGGPTPQRSWLTCEEIETKAGSGAGKDHGWVFEVPADLRGLADPVPITGMGRYKHEATATDPRTGVVYLTEDQGDSLLYRYLPNDRRRLLAGGRLQALGVRDNTLDLRNWERPAWRQGQRLKTLWIDLEGVDSPGGDLRKRGHAKGAARFARGEGLVFGSRELFITCTNGGPTRDGQILRYRPSPQEGQPGEHDAPGEIELFLESPSAATMSMPDNLCISPRGHLMICEDKYAGKNALKGVTPRGQVYEFGRNAASPLPGAPNAELAGVCFSPDGSTLFVNIYSPGITLAITGPWKG